MRGWLIYREVPVEGLGLAALIEAFKQVSSPLEGCVFSDSCVKEGSEVFLEALDRVLNEEPFRSIFGKF
jgi:hypothetical protein